MRTTAVVLCVVACALSSVSADPRWVASFVDQISHDHCRDWYFRDQSSPSAKAFDCDHSTIEFNPTKDYSDVCGEQQVLEVLAYAQDEHGQALLVKLVHGDTFTTNHYSHITVSSEGIFPYSAVYSNVLWERFEAAGALILERDDDGHILNASLPAGATKLDVNLPEFQPVLQPDYPLLDATSGHIELTPNHRFRSTICYDNRISKEYPRVCSDSEPKSWSEQAFEYFLELLAAWTA